MIELDGTLFIQMINFLITLVVLNFLLIRPIRGQIAARASLTSEYATDIEKFTANAASKLTAYEASLAEARTKASHVREAVKSEAQAAEQEMLQAAHSEAQEYLQSAKVQISSDSAKAMKTLLSQVNSYAAKAADKILG